MADKIQTLERKFQLIAGSLRDEKKGKNDKSEYQSDFFGKFNISAFNQDVLEIVSALKGKGYDVKALHKSEFHDLYGFGFPWSPAFEKKAYDLEANIECVSVPGMIGLMFGAGVNPVFNWLHNASERPRDAFVQIGDKIYLNPDYYPKRTVLERDYRGYISRMRWLVPGELEKIEEVERENREQSDKMPDPIDHEKWDQYQNECKKIWRKKEEAEKRADESLTSILKPNPFGESGRVIVFDDFIIASKEVQRKLKVSGEYRFQGRPVYFVSPITAKIGKFTKQPKEIRFHIDYHVNGLDLEDHAFLFVDPDFYEKNRGVFKRIEAEQSVDISCVPKRERYLIPANFLVIPDSRILMPAGMPQSYRSLEQKIGTGNVLTTKKPLLHLLKEGYGIRCITNVICY